MGKDIRFWIMIAIPFFVAFYIQFNSPLIIGADGFLHARMASEILTKKWFLTSLPQAHFSWFLNRFSDKDFVYHLYLIPFISLFGLIMGTKIAAFICTGWLYCLLSYLSYKRIKSWVSVIPMLLIISSSQFLRDTAEARPFILAISFTVLGIYFMSDKRLKLLFTTVFIYGLIHISAWTLPLCVLIYSIFNWIKFGIFSKKMVFGAWLVYLVSFIFHPNFPNNIFYMYLNGVLVPFYAAKTGVLELGAEFFPINTMDIINRFPAIPIGIAFLVLMFFLISIHKSKRLVAFGMGTILFGIFSMSSVRNFTHMYPLFILFITECIALYGDEYKKIDTNLRQRLLSILIPLLTVIFIFLSIETMKNLPAQLMGDRVYGQHFFKMAQFINQNIPKGSRIFHTNWSDSQYLIGLAPDYEYFVTLDPIYMYSYNKELYQLYRNVSFGGAPDPYKTLTQVFKSNYGYAGKNYFGAFINQIRSDSRFKILAEDEFGLVYKID
jgi:hypothetical protein